MRSFQGGARHIVVTPGAPGLPELSTVSSADGSFAFSDVIPSTSPYAVAEVSQSGWKPTQPSDGSYQVNVTPDSGGVVDFGNLPADQHQRRRVR
jgi:hypothetical protein